MMTGLGPSSGRQEVGCATAIASQDRHPTLTFGTIIISRLQEDHSLVVLTHYLSPWAQIRAPSLLIAYGWKVEMGSPNRSFRRLEMF